MINLYPKLSHFQVVWKFRCTFDNMEQAHGTCGCTGIYKLNAYSRVVGA